MDRAPRTALVALAIALLLVSATAASGAIVAGSSASQPAQATSTAPSVGGASSVDASSVDASSEAPAESDRVDPLTECFAGEGYPLSIGETGAAIEALVHLSVLTDPAVGNEFGMEAAGTLDGEPIVTLAAGVRLTAREAITDGVDPFAAFDVLYTYELRLPMFDGSIGDSEYRDSGSPFTSGAGIVPC
ncbi:DUF7332 family protein [Halorubrum trueperi]|uniref:Uncharacterized protein n=1 Tax=Halorubrum trueperi TaxID=2004704 RepID=A0ABD5UJR3_9EURY